jgi:hypothetical protein
MREPPRSEGRHRERGRARSLLPRHRIALITPCRGFRSKNGNLGTGGEQTCGNQPGPGSITVAEMTHRRQRRLVFIAGLIGDYPALGALLWWAFSRHRVNRARDMRPKKPSRRFTEGDVVGNHYRVLRLIAAGGMAEVYEVIDQRTGLRWALKTPNDRYANNRRVVARMVREAKSLSMINDPSLVRVFDAGEHDGHFFMVMEYIDGCPLKTLAEERALPLGVVLSLIRQVCLAVHVLHQLRARAPRHQARQHHDPRER